MTFALDTNAFDLLSSSEERVVRVARLCATGAVRFETTPVQERELARLAAVDRARHRRADRIPRHVVPAAPAPPGGRHARDARIAAAALRDGRTLVTDDSRLRESAAGLGLPAWEGARLVAHLERLDARRS